MKPICVTLDREKKSLKRCGCTDCLGQLKIYAQIESEILAAIAEKDREIKDQNKLISQYRILLCEIHK